MTDSNQHAEEAEASPAEQALRRLVPTDPMERRRAFAALLRAIVTGGSGSAR